MRMTMAMVRLMVDGWYPAQVSSPTLPICDRLPIPPLSLSPCTYILSLWWLCCHDDDDGDNNDDATTCMQAWQRQLFPVKVTRSPVGKGRLHRAHVKQAWGETYFLSNSKDKSQCRELSPGEKYFQERWPPLLRQRGCISRTLSQNLSEMLMIVITEDDNEYGNDCEDGNDDDDDDDQDEPDNIWCSSSGNLW